MLRAAGALVGGAVALGRLRRQSRGYDQDRHSPFAVRHDGDQRDDAQRRDADADRRAEQERRRARQEARGGGRRSRLELAAVRRKGARADRARTRSPVVFGCWTSVSRKSVLPVFKELNSILFYPVQYEGEESQRNVFYTGAAPEPAGDPGRRLSDERRRRLGEALGAGRHRLRLSAHHQQDPRRLSESQGRRRTKTS